MLVFTPDLTVSRAPLEALSACLAEIDVVQVRLKPEGRTSGPAPARETFDWTRRVLELCRRLGPDAPLVVVNDRVDVAAALEAEGCAGAHVGTEDTPPREARSVLGEAALLGLSTHGARDVADAADEPIDYIGFGPIHPTETRGYARGIGAEAAWIAATASTVPVYPIGGIDAENACELAPVGRAAVGSAILTAADPAAVARSIRASLAEGR